MRVSKVAVTAGLAVVLVIAVAVAVVQSLDFNEYKPTIIDAVRDATGRNLVLEGDIGLRVGLSPSLVVDGVRFQNASWGSRPDMMTVKRFELTVGLIPLLHGAIDVERVALIEPDLLLETSKKGEHNWVFTTTQAEKDPGAPVDIRLGAGIATNARIEYRDAASGRSETFELQALTSTALEDGERIEVRTKAVYNQTPFELEGRLGRLANLMRGDTYPVDLTLKALDTALKVEGSIAELGESPKIDLRFEADASTTAGLTAYAGLDLPAIGPVQVSGALRNPEGPFRLDDVFLTARLGQAELKGEGNLADLAALTGIDVVLKLDTPSMQELSPLAAGQQLPAVGPVTLSGRVVDVKGGFQVRKLNYRLGESDLAGEITVKLGGKRPSIESQLQSAVLDLDTILGTPDEPPTSGEDAPAASETPPRVFPDTQFPVAALREIDIDASAKIARLAVGGLLYSNLEYKATLEGGRLEFKPLRVEIGGGSVSATTTLDASGKVPRLDTRIDVEGVELGRVLDQVEGRKGLLTGAPITAKLRLKGDGTGVRELLAVADGELSIQLGEGTIDYATLTKSNADAVLDMRALIAPRLEPSPKVDVYCGVVRFAIGNGQALSRKGIAIETRRINVAGGGRIDLRTEAIDLAIKPTPREGVGIGGGVLADLVAIGGTLAEPAPTADVLGIAKSGASVGAAVATGGLSLLGQVVYDQLAKDREPCKTALAADMEPPDKRAPAPVSGEGSGPSGAGQGLLDPADGG